MISARVFGNGTADLYFDNGTGFYEPQVPADLAGYHLLTIAKSCEELAREKVARARHLLEPMPQDQIRGSRRL